MKRVVSILVVLSILISSTLPYYAYSQEKEKKSSQRIEFVVQKQKKKSIFSRVTKKIKNFFFKANLTIWYYFLVTIGLVDFFGNIGVFNPDTVYKEFKDKNYANFFESISSNVKSVPECVKMIYDANELTNKESQGKDSEYEKKVEEKIKMMCSLNDKNVIQDSTCKIINSIKRINDKGISKFNKFSSVLRDLSETEKTTVKAWDYLRTHAALLWISSFIGSIIGIFGSLFGAANIGWIYGITMIPYLWSLKNEKIGDLEILANCTDLTYNFINSAKVDLDYLKSQISSYLSYFSKI